MSTWLDHSIAVELRGMPTIEILEGHTGAMVATAVGVYVIKNQGTSVRLFRWKALRGIDFTPATGVIVLLLTDGTPAPQSYGEALVSKASIELDPTGSTQNEHVVGRLAKLIESRGIEAQTTSRPSPETRPARGPLRDAQWAGEEFGTASDLLSHRPESVPTPAPSLPVSFVRTYRSDAEGDQALRADADHFGRQGYAITGQWEQTGKLKTKNLLITGGLGAAFGYARGKGGVHEIGTRSVTFTKVDRGR
jgi:hypothetical protein